MAILDSFEKVTDGDQLNDGYFNGVSYQVLKNNIKINWSVERQNFIFGETYRTAGFEVNPSNRHGGTLISDEVLVFDSCVRASYKSNLTSVSVFQSRFFEDFSTGSLQQSFNSFDAGSHYYMDTGTTGTITMRTATFDSPVSYISSDATKVFAYVDYETYNLLDGFDDGSVSGDWTTTGTVTESSGKLQLAASSTAYYTGKDFYNTNDTAVFAMEHDPTTNNSYLKITDGTNDVTLITNTVATSQEIDVLTHVKFYTDDTCDVWADFRYIGNFDLSSLVAANNRYIKLETEASSVARMVYLADNTGTQTSTVTLKASADGGSNYTTCTNQTINTIGTSGRAPFYELDLSRTSGELIIIRGIGFHFFE